MGLFDMFGGGGNKVTGYNCQEVNALRDVINSTAESSGSTIVDRLHTDIVVPMSTVWYAPEAVEFFNKFAEVVKASGQAITDYFDQFRAAVEEAGKNWAENTDGEIPNLPAIDTVELTLSVSEISKDNNGNVTIDETQANSIASKLGEVESSIKSDLEKLAANLNAETAFIGGNQASSLESCFQKVSGEVHRIFSFLTEGDNSLQSQINAAVIKYQEVSSGISSAFDNAVGK